MRCRQSHGSCRHVLAPRRATDHCAALTLQRAPSGPRHRLRHSQRQQAALRQYCPGHRAAPPALLLQPTPGALPSQPARAMYSAAAAGCSAARARSGAPTACMAPSHTALVLLVSTQGRSLPPAPAAPRALAPATAGAAAAFDVDGPSSSRSCCRLSAMSCSGTEHRYATVARRSRCTGGARVAEAPQLTEQSAMLHRGFNFGLRGLRSVACAILTATQS